MQFANCSWRNRSQKLVYSFVEKMQILTLRVFESAKNQICRMILKPLYNSSLHQLLGLRLLFCFSWRIIWCQQFWFSKEIL